MRRLPCPKCRYNLAGLPPAPDGLTCCPECGRWWSTHDFEVARERQSLRDYFIPMLKIAAVQAVLTPLVWIPFAAVTQRNAALSVTMQFLVVAVLALSFFGGPAAFCVVLRRRRVPLIDLVPEFMVMCLVSIAAIVLGWVLVGVTAALLGL